MRNHPPKHAAIMVGAAAALAVIAATVVPTPAHASGLVISEWLANVTGDDNRREYVELVATKNINFAATPYTLIFTNHDGNRPTGAGWDAGLSVTYGFEITSGTVQAGSVVYVGGDLASSLFTGTPTFVRAKNTNDAGDGGIGMSGSATSGRLGSVEDNANGIAVFPFAAAAITRDTVPTDAVFFGQQIGLGATNVPGAFVYRVPDNDLYDGGLFGTGANTTLAPSASTVNRRVRAIGGVFDPTAELWTTARTFGTFDGPTDAGASAISVTAVPEPGVLALAGAAVLPVVGAVQARRRRVR